MNTKQKMPAWRSPWVLAALVMFILVVSVNISFLFLSTSTNPGLVTEEYMKYGLQQNEFEIQSREQIDRGWQVSLNLPITIVKSVPAEVVVIARKKDGSPLTGARAELASYRPSDANQDRSFELKERPGKPGEYSAMMMLPLEGVWDINMLLEMEGESHVKAERVNVILAEGEGLTTSEPSALENVVNFLKPSSDKP
jgi:nitrogen fixation protein FixH